VWWIFEHRLDYQGLGKERAGPGLFVLNSHPESGKRDRAAEAGIVKKEDGNLVWMGRGLQNDSVQLAERADEFGGERADGFNAQDLRMESRGGLKFKIGGGIIALGSENDKTAVAAGGQKALDRRSFFAVALVGAAFVTRRQAHFHLGVDAAGVAWIGREIVGAAAKEEELEGLLSVAFSGRVRRKGAVGPIGFALAGAMRYGDARVGITAQEADEGWTLQVETFQGLGAVNLLEEIELEEQRLEFGAGETPFNAADSGGELKAAGVFGRGLQKAGEACAEVGGAADIGLGVRVSSV
jgi:hypothetical protein